MNIKQKTQLKLDPIIEFMVFDAEVPVDIGDGGEQAPVKKKTPAQRRESPGTTEIHGITKRETKWVHQSFAASEWLAPAPPSEEWSLRQISQPPNVKIDKWKDYLYHESAGNGVWVHIQDTGLNLQNAEIKRLENTPEWIFVDDIAGQIVNHPADDYYDYQNYGTCMLDLAVGKRNGIARNAQAVVMKYTYRNVHKKPNGNDDWHPYYHQRLSDYIKALEEIWSHIKGTEGEEGFANAVINQSQGIFTKHLENDADYGDLRTWIEELLVKAMDLGAIVLTSAGNGGDQALNQVKWPTLLASAQVPVIVVGSSDYQGKHQSNTDISDMVTVYAPGGRVMCAYGWRSAPNVEVPNFTVKDGTSEACATTSGLVAYYLSLPTYPGDKSKPNPFAEHSPPDPKGFQKLKDKVLRPDPLPERPKGIERQRAMVKLLQDLAYPRIEGGPKIIYNGAPAGKLKKSKECSVPVASRLARRAGEESCEASSPSCTKSAITVPKSAAVAMIDAFCKGHEGNMLSSRIGENYYEATSGTGVSGLHIRHRSPPTSFITASVKWDNSPGCDKTQFKSNIDVCRTGMQAAIDICQGDGYSGGTTRVWAIILSSAAGIIKLTVKKAGAPCGQLK
ncbi:peptidase S8/S53 domain-containing protein [Trichophaea hybrida]|nr:peptidase S8/S53 domain-containing protein [Trichophaea hybrida]